MATLFTNILIPVDVSANTNLAIQKAIELAQPANAVIHLFHVADSFQHNAICVHGHFIGAIAINDWNKTAIEKKLQPYKQIIKKALPNAEVNIHIASCDGIEHNIIEIANRLNTQLIVIGKSKTNRWFSFFNIIDANRLAQKTNSVVLTVKPGAADSNIKSIVLPVRNFVPVRKIALLEAVTGTHKPTVHLITLHDKDHNKTGAFLDTYRTISEHMHYPVKYRILEGNNFPKAILGYATRTKADIIFANPITETRINSIYGTDICDLISPASKLAVFTAEPFRN